MQVKIIDYDDLGNGLTKIENKVCFVKRGLPNELLDIIIINEKKNYKNGVINNVIEANINRIKPICKYYENCGGCDFLHITNEEEISFKKEKCKRVFKQLDKFYETINFNYRNKVTLHVQNGKIGFYEEKTNNIVKITSCFLLLEEMNKIIELLENNFDRKFNGKIIIRENYQKETIVAIYGNYEFIDVLKDSSLVTNLIVNDEIIKGKKYFLEKIQSYQFKVSYDSFFQVNRIGLLKIYEILNDFCYLNKFKKALDLYSGTSVLGIFISKYVDQVISVESNSSSTKDANYNIELNNVKNLQIINQKVENVIETFHDIDLVLVDPTRNGLDKKTISYLKKINSSYIIYIACKMESLKRDLLRLDDNYCLDKLYAVDMFPRTNHVECVCILKLK